MVNLGSYPSISPNLPIVPSDVLDRFHVAGIGDTRFSRCARLLQSIWRERRNLEAGWHKASGRKARRLGNLLPPSVGSTGVTFMASDIARIARREVAYREYGALIDERRLWQNLLSSQALTFNLLARVKMDRDFACRLFSHLLPHQLSEVHHVAFEHSPGRGDPAFLGDYTAFDAGVWGRSPSGDPVFIAIEVKYAESMQRPERGNVARLQELATRFNLYRDPGHESLFTEPFAQLTAEHLLAELGAQRLGKNGRAILMTIAPAMNREAWTTIYRYQSSLMLEAREVTFSPVTLEAVVAAIEEAGDRSLAAQLAERYTDFEPVHQLIDQWEPVSL